MAKSKKSGSAPNSLFIEAKAKTFNNRDGKKVEGYEIVHRFKIGGGYGLTLILPEDSVNLTTSKDGKTGVWVKFYNNYPKNNY